VICVPNFILIDELWDLLIYYKFVETEHDGEFRRLATLLICSLFFVMNKPQSVCDVALWYRPTQICFVEAAMDS